MTLEERQVESHRRHAFLLVSEGGNAKMVTAVRNKMVTVASVTVDRPVEAVWKFFASGDLSKVNPEDTGFQQSSAGPIGVGTTFREMRSKMPKRQDLRVTGFEPNLKLGLEIFSGPIKGSKITYSLENIEGKTKLTETADFSNVPAITRLLSPFIDRPGKAEKEATDRLVNIKNAVESEAK